MVKYSPRSPILIEGDDSFATVELVASFPKGTSLKEGVDPLRDFLDCESLLGFASTGEDEWTWRDYPVGSAALWEVHDYYNRPQLENLPEEREWATFLLTVALIGDRLPLRPLCAVWEIVLSALSEVNPLSLTVHVRDRGHSDKQPLRPEYLIRSHTYMDRDPHSIFQEPPEGTEYVSCRAVNSVGEEKALNLKKFTPMRLAEIFELLSPGGEEFWVSASRGA